METIGSAMRDTESLYISDAGDYEESSTGIRLDSSPRTKALLALKAHRGEYWADLEYGSRLHKRKTLRDFQCSAQDDCQEALQFLIDRGEILSVTVRDIQQHPSTGSVSFWVTCLVTENDQVDILVQRERPST